MTNKTRLRVITDASKLDASDRFCRCCQRPLKGRFAYLELDQRHWRYHDFGGVPTNKSQGWFPFGMTCARRIVADTRAAIAELEAAE